MLLPRVSSKKGREQFIVRLTMNGPRYKQSTLYILEQTLKINFGAKFIHETWLISIFVHVLSLSLSCSVRSLYLHSNHWLLQSNSLSPTKPIEKEQVLCSKKVWKCIDFNKKRAEEIRSKRRWEMDRISTNRFWTSFEIWKPKMERKRNLNWYNIFAPEERERERKKSPKGKLEDLMRFLLSLSLSSLHGSSLPVPLLVRALIGITLRASQCNHFAAAFILTSIACLLAFAAATQQP